MQFAVLEERGSFNVVVYFLNCFLVDICPTYIFKVPIYPPKNIAGIYSPSIFKFVWPLIRTTSTVGCVKVADWNK